jgi:hypothetical protein
MDRGQRRDSFGTALITVQAIIHGIASVIRTLAIVGYTPDGNTLPPREIINAAKARTVRRGSPQ